MTKQPTPEPTPTPTPTPTPDSPNHEAAKYRHRLRDAETERDALQTELGTRNRAAIERAAANHLAMPGHLFDIGNHLQQKN